MTVWPVFRTRVRCCCVVDDRDVPFGKNILVDCVWLRTRVPRVARVANPPSPHTHIFTKTSVEHVLQKFTHAFREHKSFKWRKTMSNCESDICKFDLLGLLIKYITHYWILLYNWSIARFRVELEIYGEKNKTFVNAGLMEMLIPAGKTRHWFFKFFFFFLLIFVIHQEFYHQDGYFSYE